MFKEVRFSIRKVEDIIADLELARQTYQSVERIFLIDGDALVLKTEYLGEVLMKIQELFPECNRVGLSSTSMDILRKTPEDLVQLQTLGLKIIYLGVETGSELLLKGINKGVTSSEIIEAGIKVKNAGIKLSVSIISGLGGKEHWKSHAIETARVISAINPDFIGLLTLVIEKDTGICNKVSDGEMTLLTPIEVMIETKTFIENLDLDGCLFRGNHASNYAPLSGTLNQDKEHLLTQLGSLIEGNHSFKNDIHRHV